MTGISSVADGVVAGPPARWRRWRAERGRAWARRRGRPEGGAGGRPGLTQLRRRAGELPAPTPGSYSRATPRRGARSGPSGPEPAPMGARRALAPPPDRPRNSSQGEGGAGLGPRGPGRRWCGGAVGSAGARSDWGQGAAECAGNPNHRCKVFGDPTSGSGEPCAPARGSQSAVPGPSGGGERRFPTRGGGALPH